VLMPLWDASLLHRYEPELKTIAEHLEKLHVVYLTGEPQGGYAQFHKAQMKRVPGPQYLTFMTNRRHVWDQVRDVDADVYYCLSGFWFEQYMAYFSRRAGKPYVVRLRGDDVKVRELYGRPRVQRWLMKRLYIDVLRRASLVVPISRTIHGLALSHGVDPEKVTPPLPNGVDTRLFRYTPFKDFDTFTLGYAGRLSPEKGMDFLTRLMEETPDVNYIVAGRDQIDWRPPKNADYWGEIKYRDMPKFYRAINLLLIPSYTEGFSRVLREAYAMGRPVIIAETALTPETWLFGLCLKHSLTAWKNGIHALRGDYQARGERSKIVEWGLKASEWARRFSWPEYGRRLKEYLRRVVE